MYQPDKNNIHRADRQASSDQASDIDRIEHLTWEDDRQGEYHFVRVATCKSDSNKSL